MAFYAHFSQSIFLHTTTPFWLSARQTFVVLKFVLFTFANQKWQSRQLDIIFEEKILLLVVWVPIEKLNLIFFVDSKLLKRDCLM